ncbi:MAG: antibiotic biosynthesis monooxygenase [Chloroflexi bacterium]|nr:antibiotic biosynthesis monooxygenase [Chloroflexota bacterium]
MEESPAPVLLLTAWHLPSMRSAARAFWLARRLDRLGREAPGCVGMHRWVSRRSVLLTSWWRSREAAESWFRSPPVRELDDRLRSLPGAEARVELREDGRARPTGG